MKSLSFRQNYILRNVVETHIETSQPVASRMLAERYAFDCSPATIRSEMGSLEDLGYLMHPHTSSGRIPTDSGYRYYLTHTSFSSNTEWNAGGWDETEIEQSAKDDEPFFLEEISRFLSFVSQEVGLALTAGGDLNVNRKSTKISVQGLPCIFEKPEFQDIKKARNLVEILEEKEVLSKIFFQNTATEAVSVSIGHEHEEAALRDCAIVRARYTTGSGHDAFVAVLGPKRMSYQKIIPLVSYAADLANRFSKRMEF